MNRNKLVLGCAPLGGLYHRDISVEQARSVIRAAVLKHGIRELDTAPWYGSGRSEQDIGAILADPTDQELQAAGRSIRIVTKVGRRLVPKKKLLAEGLEKDPRVVSGDTCYKIIKGVNDHVLPMHDYTAQGIVASLVGSVRRLRVNGGGGGGHQAQITELRLHDAETDERIEEAMHKGGVDELMRQCQLLGAKPSLGMNDPKYILRLLESYPHKFASALMAGSWNLLDQSGLGVLVVAEQQEVEIHVAGIFGAGLLWGGSHFRYRPAQEPEIKRRDAWVKLCKDDLGGVSLPAAAFAFASLPAPVTKIVFGCTTTEELDACVRAADESVRIPVGKLISVAAARGLIAADVAAKCAEWVKLREQQQQEMRPSSVVARSKL